LRPGGSSQSSTPCPGTGQPGRAGEGARPNGWRRSFERGAGHGGFSRLQTCAPLPRPGGTRPKRMRPGSFICLRKGLRRPPGSLQSMVALPSAESARQVRRYSTKGILMGGWSSQRHIDAPRLTCCRPAPKNWGKGVRAKRKGQSRAARIGPTRRPWRTLPLTGPSGLGGPNALNTSLNCQAISKRHCRLPGSAGSRTPRQAINRHPPETAPLSTDLSSGPPGSSGPTQPLTGEATLQQAFSHPGQRNCRAVAGQKPPQTAAPPSTHQPLTTLRSSPLKPAAAVLRG